MFVVWLSWNHSQSTFLIRNLRKKHHSQIHAFNLSWERLFFLIKPCDKTSYMGILIVNRFLFLFLLLLVILRNVRVRSSLYKFVFSVFVVFFVVFFSSSFVFRMFRLIKEYMLSNERKIYLNNTHTHNVKRVKCFELTNHMLWVVRNYLHTVIVILRSLVSKIAFGFYVSNANVHHKYDMCNVQCERKYSWIILDACRTTFYNNKKHVKITSNNRNFANQQLAWHLCTLSFKLLLLQHFLHSRAILMPIISLKVHFIAF